MITLIADYLMGKYGTTSASDLSGEDAQDLLRDKYRLLTSLYDALEEQKRDINSQAVDLYEADMRAYTSAQQAKARLLQSISEGRDKLTQEQIRQMGANARTLMETQGRLLATYGSRGRSKYESVARAVYGADPIRGDNDQPGYRTAVLLKLADLDPNDPATKLAIEAALESFGMSEANLPNSTRRTYAAASASYAKAVKAQEDMKSLVDSADAGTLTAEEAQARMSSLPDFAPPSFTAKRTEVEGQTDVSELQAKIAALEGDIQSSETTTGKIGNVSRDEALAILQNPSFRAWAESRGFKLGEVRDGGYVPRVGDYAALSAAARELAGGPVFRKGREGASASYQVVKPEEAGIEASLKYDDEGKVTDGWFVHPNGVIVRVDAATGKTTIVQQGGKWISPAERAAWEAQSKESPAVPRMYGGAALTDVEFQRLQGQPIYVDQFELGQPPGPGAYVDVVGVEQPIRLGDDPNTTRRIRTETGAIVTLKRDEAGNWTMADAADWGNIKKPPEPEYSRATKAETRRWEERIAQLPGEPGKEAAPAAEPSRPPGFFARVASKVRSQRKGDEVTEAGGSAVSPAVPVPVASAAAPSLSTPIVVTPEEETAAPAYTRALAGMAKDKAGRPLGITPETEAAQQALALAQADRALAATRGGPPIAKPATPEQDKAARVQQMLQQGATPREVLKATEGDMRVQDRLRKLRELRKQKKAQSEPEPELRE